MSYICPKMESQRLIDLFGKLPQVAQLCRRRSAASVGAAKNRQEGPMMFIVADHVVSPSDLQE